MAVQKIQAKKTVRQQHISESPVKLKVAAYCRVSTDSLEQESSYEAQCVHYIEYIQNNPRWELPFTLKRKPSIRWMPRAKF